MKLYAARLCLNWLSICPRVTIIKGSINNIEKDDQNYGKFDEQHQASTEIIKQLMKTLEQTDKTYRTTMKTSEKSPKRMQ